MFLAWKEMIHSKTRYAMIILVLILLSYLVFFLTGLAFGLGQANRSAVDDWQADKIVLSADANGRLNASMIKKDQIALENDRLEGISVLSLVVEGKTDESDDRISLTLLAVEEEGQANPQVKEGQANKDPFEVIASASLKEVYGFQLGDQLSLIGRAEKLTITGFTDDLMLSVSPILYTSPETAHALRANRDSEANYSALLVYGDSLEQDIQNNSQLEVLSINEFIEKLPGYQAQNLTFAMIIIFLIVIAAIIIGIFIYVLTLQKTKVFGVMKAQGISSAYISRSVIAQTLILSLLGLGIGLVLAVVTAIYLPQKVPFAFSWELVVISLVSMLIFAILGAFLSVRQIVNIDPSQAIS